MLTSGIELMDGRSLHTDLISIPKKAGVYSWYRRLSVDDLDPAVFKATLEDRLHANTVLPVFTGESGPYIVGLKPGKTELSEKKVPLADAVAATAAHRTEFAQALLVSSIFQPPLYVGKADDLRVRIKQHRDGDTGFSKEMTTLGLMPTELVVAFVTFAALPKRTNELLEYVITILSTPPFVKRRG